MTIDFHTLPVDRAIGLAEYSGDKLAVLKQNRDFYNGEHWQNGHAWIGPWPELPEGATRMKALPVQRLQLEIRRSQVTINAIKECVDRETSGTIGIEPRWGFTADGIRAPLAPDPAAPTGTATNESTDEPTPEEQARQRVQTRIDRANALATAWWDRRGVHQQLQDLATKLLYGAGDNTEASLRLYIPAAMLSDVVDTATGKATGQKVLEVKSIDDALDKIHLETLDADAGRVVQDADTLADIGIKPAKRGEEQVAEVTYLDPATKKTVIATIRATSRPSIALDLGGRLTMLTVTRKPFVTEQVRQSQRALNFAAFVVKRNNETAGFLQDTLLNVEIPGHFEGEGDKRRYVADPIERGPLALNALRGIQQENGDGTMTLTTPSIDHRQPVDPTPTIKAKQEHHADILGACNQRHALIAGDALPSGDSRIHARVDHVDSLRKTQTPIERAGRWVLETALAMADALANNGTSSGLLTGLRLSFTCYLDAGPVSAAERAENLNEMNAGVLSRETTIERNGTVDVDAELRRIGADPSTGLDAELKRAQIFQAWITAGVGEVEAARRAGLTPKEIAALVESPTDTTVVTQ